MIIISESNYDICQNCIVTNSFFGLKINSDGLCDFCVNPAHVNPNWKKVQIRKAMKQSCLQDWNNTVKEMKELYGDQENCCVLGFSGGKDSTALVDMLINEYHLRPFLVTLNTGYMTDIAINNIKQTLQKMNLEKDHIFIDDAIPLFTKLYRFLFYNHNSNEKGLTLEICHLCTDILHTLLVKEAMKKKLKFVVIGFSPDQIARYFYETSPKDTLRDGLPRPEKFKKTLDKNELKLYLDENLPLDSLPRVLYPYHVIHYDEHEIIKRIEAKELIDKGKGNPVLTNCHVVKVALMYDLYRYGGITYALQYAELIRQKPIHERKKARKELLIVLLSFSRSIFRGTFNMEGFNRFFKRIGTTREELLEVIEKQREKDPNKDMIEKNIELLRSMQLK